VLHPLLLTLYWTVYFHYTYYRRGGKYAPYPYLSAKQILHVGRLSPNYFNFLFRVNDVIVGDVIGEDVFLAKNRVIFSMTL